MKIDSLTMCFLNSEIMVFCDGTLIKNNVKSVDEEIGVVEVYDRDAKGYPDREETIAGKIEIMLKPNASERARVCFEKIRTQKSKEQKIAEAKAYCEEQIVKFLAELRGMTPESVAQMDAQSTCNMMDLAASFIDWQKQEIQGLRGVVM